VHLRTWGRRVLMGSCCKRFVVPTFHVGLTGPPLVSGLGCAAADSGSGFQLQNRQKKHYIQIIVSVIGYSVTRRVCIAKGCMLDDRGIGVRFVAGETASRLALGHTQPPVHSVPRLLSPVLKRQGCEAGHSPSSAENKKSPPLPLASSYFYMLE
jgi:hypothetical protein